MVGMNEFLMQIGLKVMERDENKTQFLATEIKKEWMVLTQKLFENLKKLAILNFQALEFSGKIRINKNSIIVA